MIKRADASSIKREKATKEQIAENFKRLAVDTDKKVQLKPSILKTVKSLDGKTFGIIHENKTYYLKYTTKNGSNNPVDFKHLDGLNSSFGIEKFNSFDRAVNKMSFICEAQNNAHKLRLLNESEEELEEKISDEEEKLLGDLDTQSKEEPAAEEMPSAETPATQTPAADMSGEEMPPAAETPAPEMGSDVDTTKTGTETPKDIAGKILPAIGDTPEGGEEQSVADMGAETPAAPEDGKEKDLNDEIQSKIGETQPLITDLKQDKTKYDSSFIKTTINSLLGYWGDALEKLDSDDIKDIKDRLEGSQVSSDDTEKEAPVEEVPAEEPSTEKLDENLLRQLKSESKRLLKEQLKQEIEKRKRSILIESIKRKLK
jgi:hypothetical protein